jgi:glucose/mannose-6-phosphate isomerase
MLDDLKLIHERDAEDALGVAEKQWQQLQHDFGVNFQPQTEIRNVVLAGMGGSALPGVFLNAWPGLSVPFEIVRNYDLPAYVNEHTLETLSALAQAQDRGAQIVVIASGGKLAEQAETADLPLLRIPGGIQPRMCSFFFLTAFMQVMEPLRLVPAGSLQQLRDAGTWLSGQLGTWLPTVATKDNPAKQLALELIGKSIVVYAGPKLFPAANKWKICMNENAKNVAWCNQLPEFNHNEFIGWSSHPTDKPYAVIDLRSNLEHPRTQKRFEVSERLLSGMRPVPQVVEIQGETLIEQLLWAATMGDFVSLYLALLNGLNPTPVDLVEKFKLALNE